MLLHKLNVLVSLQNFRIENNYDEDILRNFKNVDGN